MFHAPSPARIPPPRELEKTAPLVLWTTYPLYGLTVPSQCFLLFLNINLCAGDLFNQKSGYICQIAQYPFIFLLCNHAENVKDCFYSTLSLLTGIYAFWRVIL